VKNAAKVFNGWFWSWVGISLALLAAMLIIGNENHTNTNTLQLLAGMILALFMLMPIRNWAYRFVVWALDYVSSINTRFKDRVNQHATYNRMINPLVREENVGFYRAVKIGINMITTILALNWLVFNRTSFNIVYAFVHTWEFIFAGKISYLAMLIFVLLKAAFVYLIFWFAGNVLKGTLYKADGSIDWSKSWWKILIMVVTFFVEVIGAGLLMRYTPEMLGHKVFFWTASVSFPILIAEISRLVGIYKKRHAPPTP